MSTLATRVFRDPVHGTIAVPSGLLTDLIDSREFQRLRNIRQLGLCLTTFHGAEHSRFQHALGVMWLMWRILERWRQEECLPMDAAEQSAGCAAALLHDLGHGPFSHALERVFVGLSHEAVGRRMILDRLGPIFQRHGQDPARVVQILEGSYARPVFSELITSQVDVDRMDYLQRDSLYTGVRYGLFDCERILHSLMPWGEAGHEVLALDGKGTEAVEEFLFSRYFMHWQVYFHRTVRSAELLLRVVLERAREVWLDSPGKLDVPRNLLFLFEAASHKNSSWDHGPILDALVGIDDFDVFHAIKLWGSSADATLADLSTRLLERRLFKVVPAPANLDAVRTLVQKRFGETWSYYLREDNPRHLGLGFAEGGLPPIRVVKRGATSWQELRQVTRTGAVDALGQTVTESYLMIAPECRDAALALGN